MASVTGGKILFNRSVQPAPYETKALGAEWSFSTEPGEDAAAISRKMAADMMALVNEALGLVKPKMDRPSAAYERSVTAQTEDKPSGAPEAAAVSPPAAASTSVRLYTVAALPVAPSRQWECVVTDALNPVNGGAVVGGGEMKCPVAWKDNGWVFVVSAKDLAIEDAKRARAPRKPKAVTTSSVTLEHVIDPDEIGGDVAGAQPVQSDIEEFTLAPEPAAKGIPDADLTGAAARAVTKLGDGGGPKVREYAAKFRTDPTKAFQLKDIPQERRQDFLNGLEKLS